MDSRNTIVDTSLDLGMNSFKHVDEISRSLSGTSSVLRLSSTDPRDEAPKHGVHLVDDCSTRKEPPIEHEVNAISHHSNINSHPPFSNNCLDGLRVQEIRRIRLENEKLTEALSLVTEKYKALRSQIPENEPTMTTSASRKRKLDDTDYGSMIRIYENGNACFPAFTGWNNYQEMWKKPKESVKSNVSKFLVPTDASDTSLVVNDGYAWRKYGQKVTRDNPSPRAYYKCSYAPDCPVKKKVQRSVDNPSILVAIYEGEHNHKCPTPAQLSPHTPKMSNTHSLPIIAPERPHTSWSNGNIIHDTAHVQHSPRPTCTSPPKQDQIDRAPLPLPQFLVQQMALSLTKDPNFTAALVDAISGKVLEEAGTESWG